MAAQWDDGYCSWCGPVECSEEHFTYCPFWDVCYSRECPKHNSEEDDEDFSP